MCVKCWEYESAKGKMGLWRERLGCIYGGRDGFVFVCVWRLGCVCGDWVVCVER